MIARLLISPDINLIKKEINKTVVKINHPDVLYFESGEKLGIAQSRKVKEHFSLKPYSEIGRVAVIEDSSVMTTEAQNALLKTLEELPEEAMLILGSPSDANILPTILSRCEIIRLQGTGNRQQATEDIEKLLGFTIEERFEFVEKIKDREEFLQAIIYFFRELLHKKITQLDAAVQHNVANEQIKDFLKELLQGEQWARQNVNIRGILEYLMLKMPKKGQVPS